MSDSETPTREEIIEDIQEGDERVNGPLSSRKLDDMDDLVSKGQVKHEFGSWDAGREAAGVPLDYTKEEILEEIRKKDQQVEGNLSQSQFIEMSYIPLSAIRKHFDSWNHAKMEAGVDIVQKQRDREELIELLKQAHEKKPDGRKLRTFLDDHNNDYPAHKVYAREFGTLLEAEEIAGLPPS